MEFNLEDKFYTMMEMLCEKIDYLFEAYTTDGFIHHAIDVYTDNKIALDILKHSFEELDSDDRIVRCRQFIQIEYPDVNSDVIIHVIRCLIITLNEWEQQRIESY